MTPRRLFWFSFRDRTNKPWRVYLTSYDLREDVEETDRNIVVKDDQTIAGLIIRPKRTIFVDAAWPVSFQDDNLLHELLHAAMVGEGFSDKSEEEIALISTPLLAILRSIGFRTPKRPRQHRAMSAVSRKRFA
jgi:hypothetical protein